MLDGCIYIDRTLDIRQITIMTNSTEGHHECQWEENFFIPKEALFVLTSFGIVVGLLAAIGNGLVLLTIFKKFSVQSSHIYFIGSLALADCLVGLITVPFYSAGSLTWPFLLDNDYFEMVLDFLIFQSLGASTYSLLVVSYDRFVAITSPLTYQSRMTMKHVYCYLGLVWFASILLGASSFMVTDYHSRPSIYLAVITSAFLIPFCMIAYFYAKIFHIARLQARQIAAIDEVSVSETGNENRKRERSDHKAAITVAIVIGTFAICWLPNLVIGLVHFAVSLYSECEAEKTEQIWLATLPFAFINSAINPAIYTVRHEIFRVGLRDLFKSCCRTNN